MIEIKDITKNYGKKTALKNISIEFGQGIYALLGANGAGKSTLLNILTTSLLQTSGTVLYNGEDIRSNPSDYLMTLGYLPQKPRFYKNYTADEFLRYMAALKGVSKNLESRTGELLSLVNLIDVRKDKIGSFSGGMIQRLGIAQALINEPQILILDEPTAGLDPIERIRLKNLISDISKGKTVIIATHIVSDIEFTANNVILLKNGEVCRNGTPGELTKEIKNKVWQVKTDEKGFENIASGCKISNIFSENNLYTLKIISDEKPFPEAFSVPPDLEDVFFYHSDIM